MITELEVLELVEAGGPTMVFQPIVEIQNGDITGYEALARFPRLGPGEWFPAAATHGLTPQLEVSAIMAALPALREITKEHYLSVNASVETLIGKALAAKFLARLGPRLVVELTEHDAVASYDLLRSCLTALRSTDNVTAGVRLGIDDLGAGHSSLRHVLELDPDMIKLDVSLVSGITKDKKRAAMVASLVTFAEATDILLVAEGIETLLDANALIDLGVIYGQGFFFYRPAPLKRWTKGSHEEAS